MITFPRAEYQLGPGCARQERNKHLPCHPADRQDPQVNPSKGPLGLERHGGRATSRVWTRAAPGIRPVIRMASGGQSCYSRFPSPYGAPAFASWASRSRQGAGAFVTCGLPAVTACAEAEQSAKAGRRVDDRLG